MAEQCSSCTGFDFFSHFGICFDNFIYWQWEDWLRTTVYVISICLGVALAIYLAYFVIKCLENSKRSNKNDKDDEYTIKNKNEKDQDKNPPSYEGSTIIDESTVIDETPPPPYSPKAMVALINRIASRLMFTNKHDARIVRYSRVPDYDM